MSATPAVGRPAYELLIRKRMRDGWLLAAAALLIPFFGIWAARNGLTVWRISRRPAAIALIVTGLAIFVVRLVLYLSAYPSAF